MLDRVWRAAKLDPDLYEMVEHQPRYLPEAALIVAVTSVLAGLGGWITTGNFVSGFISLLLVGLFGWLVWASVTLFVGTRFFGGTADLGEMLRVLGYASGPLALSIIPWGGAFIGGIWALVASIVAIKQGLDFSIAKALGTAIVGWLLLIVLRAILFAIF